MQHCSCSCSFERRPSRSKTPLADLRLSSDDCVRNAIAAALDSVLVTGATSKEPRARPWPLPCGAGMSTCLAGQSLHTLISSIRKLPSKRDNHGHTWEQMRPARQPDAGKRLLTDLQVSLGRLAWHAHFGVCLNKSEGFHIICLSIDCSSGIHIVSYLTLQIASGSFPNTLVNIYELVNNRHASLIVWISDTRCQGCTEMVKCLDHRGIVLALDTVYTCSQTRVVLGCAMH